MENIANFRELGGIPVKGGVVKSSEFFRAAELDFASPSDAEKINALGVRVVFDFRDESEKTDSSVYGRLDAEYYNVPVRTENAKLIKLRIKPDLKTVLSLNMGDVREIYADLPFCNPSYKKLFGLIKDGATPILFHCTAGKDRTGIAAALLLSLLGAERAEIVRDYMKTREAVPQIREKTLRYVNFLLRGFLAKRLRPLFDVDESYIHSALDAVFKRYGTVEAYFQAEHGYTDGDIAELRNRYTV
ncbi:MAG: tyrosine-protein phosphatase [Clostridiales bacterium]|jgi:protein-tyrosine phosphatase|nr:tyrosine-protein phosphatase [Clostridiales bacterium]